MDFIAQSEFTFKYLFDHGPATILDACEDAYIIVLFRSAFES